MSLRTRTAAIGRRRVPPPGLEFVLTATAFGAALLAVELAGPTLVRLPALAALSVVPGLALVRLLFGDGGGRGEAAVRLPLAALLGLLLWLGAALAVDAVGVPLTARTLALPIGAAGLVLVTADGLARPAPRRPPRAIAPVVVRGTRVAVGIVAAVAVVAGSAQAATALIAKPVERYTTLAFTDDKPYAGRAPVVTRGRPVRLNWALHGVGCRPSPTLTSIRLAVDGTAIDAVAVDSTETAAGSLAGAVTFSAPDRPGRHLVALTVVPAAQDGTPLPAPGYVSTFVEVER